MPARKKQQIRCRLCQWQRQAWTRTSRGQPLNNYPALVSHWYHEHREEFLKLTASLDLEFGSSPDPKIEVGLERIARET